ncbi:GNAT family N-acetyltransferase [Uliginosibacterium sp. H3]|uniref:GNAT family N-acetyltransferase n=1 Tax=Uliginosibacterium silvisoli TaxID=3114758 RepID=A0ABU6JXY5_9RHOO|nr:GNAT family N-acetyltransferase [Uliginosibacterium sp. H3]
MSAPHIDGPAADSAVAYEAILRSLPRWFGVESALQGYVCDTAHLPTFNLRHDAKLIGFVSMRQHFPRSWEIHCVAIHGDHRSKGYGAALLRHAEAWAVKQGARLLQVKTLAPSHPSVEYQQTRSFYERMGFVPLEVFPELWAPEHPCLQMIKVLGDTSDLPQLSGSSL